MSTYRKFPHELWATLHELTLLAQQRRRDEISIFMFSFIGFIANAEINITGIYTITRGSFMNHLGIWEDESTAALEYFNKEMPSLLEYDFKSHTIYVKDFFRIQYDYKKIDLVDHIMRSYEKSYQKTPRFWQEFGKINRNILQKLHEKVPEKDLETSKFLYDLIESGKI